ncbi:hypothetical protein [Bradyrhizobium sp. Rc2d]|uniref:hypothetical protein n=1 Tax=Bradyrhizobium sp. Rc2d TaxID=1855321 RepID=UPI001FCD13DE|nr:hypothetical protein [Bradyrhizobium sp. Rc2d]
MLKRTAVGLDHQQIGEKDRRTSTTLQDAIANEPNGPRVDEDHKQKAWHKGRVDAGGSINEELQESVAGVSRFLEQRITNQESRKHEEQ